MTKSEFLDKLEQALQGEVSPRVYQENLRYYDNYITQETMKGQNESQVIDSIGDPRLIAKTIIESSEAAGDTVDSRSYDGGASGDYRQESDERKRSSLHYVDLSKWYWKLLGIVVVVLFFSLVMTIVGGFFSLLIRFAGPLLMIYLVFWFIRNMRR